MISRIAKSEYFTLPAVRLLLLSLTLSSMLLLWAQPFIFGEQWGDHVFYWGQADLWLGLNQPLRLSPETTQYLEEFRVTYYYESANGLGLQPPYVYRPLAPVLAGLLGMLVPLSASFAIIHVLAVIAITFFVAWAVYAMTSSIAWSSLGALLGLAALPAITNLLRYPALVELPSMAMVAAVVALSARRSYTLAVLVAIAAGLTKETQVLLALGVAMFAAAREKKLSPRLMLLALVAPLFQVAMRVALPIPAPPSIEELFVPGNPYESILTFFLAYASVMPILVGLATRFARPWILSFGPWALSIAVVTSSVVASGSRIWLSLWPLIVSVGLSAAYYWARSLPSRIVFVAFVLGGLMVSQGEILWGLPRPVQTAWLVTFGCWLTIYGWSKRVRTWGNRNGPTGVGLADRRS